MSEQKNPIASDSSGAGSILNSQAAANVPQPIDYGLTYRETFHGLYVPELPGLSDDVPECGLNKLKYKQGDWVRFYSGWAVAVWFPLYLLGFAAFVALNPHIPGGWTSSNGVRLFFLLMAMPGSFPGFPIVCGILRALVESYKKKHPSADLLA